MAALDAGANIIAVQETRLRAGKVFHGGLRRALASFTEYTNAAYEVPGGGAVRAGASLRKRTPGACSGGVALFLHRDIAVAATARQDAVPSELRAYLQVVTLAVLPRPVALLNVYAVPGRGHWHSTILCAMRDQKVHWEASGHDVVVMGDFNATLREEDRSAADAGSVRGHDTGCRDASYRRTLREAGLAPPDAHDTRRPHTFVAAGGLATARLDDILLPDRCQSWAADGPARALHSATESDHCPLLLRLTPPTPWLFPAAPPMLAPERAPPDQSQRVAAVLRHVTEAEREALSVHVRAAAVQRHGTFMTVGSDALPPADRVDMLVTALESVMADAFESGVPARLRHVWEGAAPTHLRLATPTPPTPSRKAALRDRPVVMH
jgi:exonuclease III